MSFANSIIMIKFKPLIVYSLVSIFLTNPILAARYIDLENNWAQKYINFLSDENILLPQKDGRFNPDKPLTRADFVTWLVKLLGLENEPYPNKPSYKDVNPTDWYYKYVEIARQSNLISGYADGFRPLQYMTKGEMLLIITRYLPQPTISSKEQDEILDSFTDKALIPAWSLTSIAQAYKDGILVNYPDSDKVNALKLIDKANAAAIFYKLDRYLTKQEINNAIKPRKKLPPNLAQNDLPPNFPNQHNYNQNNFDNTNSSQTNFPNNNINNQLNQVNNSANDYNQNKLTNNNNFVSPANNNFAPPSYNPSVNNNQISSDNNFGQSNNSQYANNNFANSNTSNGNTHSSSGIYPRNYPPPANQSNNNSYPSNNNSYPSNNNPYPSNNNPYPSNNNPYPSNNSPYPSNNSPYPSNNSPAINSGSPNNYQPNQYYQGQVIQQNINTGNGYNPNNYPQNTPPPAMGYNPNNYPQNTPPSAMGYNQTNNNFAGNNGYPMMQGYVTTINSGSLMAATLKNSLDSGSTQVGEPVETTLPNGLMQDGKQVLPPNTIISGQVSEVVSAKRFKFGANGKIAINFNQVQLPDGRKFPIQASVDTNKMSLTGGSTKGRVGKSALAVGGGALGGAALGTGLGAIVGGMSNGNEGKAVGMGAVFGTAIGSGVGLVGAGVRKGSEVKIVAGTQLPIVLNAPLNIQ